MEKSLRNKLVQEKRAFDILKFKYLNARDRRNANFVGNQILNIQTGAIVVNETISLRDAFLKSVNNMRIFGDEFYGESLKFAGTKFVPICTDPLSFKTNVIFTADDDTRVVDETSGRVDHFKIPKQIDATVGDIFLTHEFLHGLKETNYQEYVNINLADVIPLFYELITADNNVKIQKDLLNIRIALLKANRNGYMVASNNIKKSKNDKDLYKIEQTFTGEYLNSFYYALILYNMYKNNSGLVLNAVSRVLKHEITTLNMLVELGIYGSKFDNVVNDEIVGIRRVLR